MAAVHAATSDAELLALANASPYGWRLTSTATTSSAHWGFAERVEAGAVGINVNDTTELQAPFGGWKRSGLGRELGREGLMTYLQPRHLLMRVRPLGD